MYILGIAILPVFVLCYYIYKKDVDKEPKKLLTKVFVLGMLSVIPIVILELIAKNYFSTDDTSDLIKLFASTFIGVALIEEFAKWCVVQLCIYKDKEFNHPYDAIVYCVFASLGFAVIENIIYVYGTGFMVGILRGILTVPSHACDAVIMGYFLSESKREEYRGNQRMSNRYMALSILMPITVHAVYDYLIFTQKELLLILFIFFVALIYIICFKLVKRVSLHNTNYDGTGVIQNLLAFNNPSINNESNNSDVNITNCYDEIERNKIANKSILYSILITVLAGFLLVIAALVLSTLFIK